MEKIEGWEPKNTLTKEWESFKRNINSFPFFSAMILFTSLFLALILKIIEMFQLNTRGSDTVLFG